MEAIFVYGTLMRGYSNHSLITSDGNSEFMGNSQIQGYAMYSNGGFPIVTPAEDSSVVFGEVWKVSSTTRKHMDILEGHPEWYTRIYKPLAVPVGRTTRAWVYLQQPEQVAGLHRVPNGSWRSFRSAELKKLKEI